MDWNNEWNNDGIHIVGSCESRFCSRLHKEMIFRLRAVDQSTRQTVWPKKLMKMSSSLPEQENIKKPLSFHTMREDYHQTKTWSKIK